MTDVLSKLKAVHAGRTSTRVYVPEYDLELFFPPLTLSDHERIRKGINPSDEHALLVSGLIHQARDKDGEAVFPATAEVKAELHKMELHVLQRIMSEASGTVPDVVEAEIARTDLRAALVTAFVEDTPALADCIGKVSVGAIEQVMRQFAIEAQAADPIKND